MGEAAVAAARAVRYTGAGTVEFIAAPDGAFYFMEMNTRLQVEHPVTEMITGIDLVEWQLRVASGEPLPLRQEQLAIHGHAIEARIYAEDPARDFLPSIGRLAHLAMPARSDQVRVDTGVRQGDEITPYYDPMIAKLIVHGADRREAIARMRGALGAFHVAGVRTNVEFLGRLMTATSFDAPQLDTALIAREQRHLFPAIEVPEDAIWEFAAWQSLRMPPPGASPWSEDSGWRLAGRSERTVTLRWGDTERAVRLRFAEPRPAPQSAEATLAGDEVHVFLGHVHRVFRVVDPYLPATESADRHGGLIAPMPGRIIAVNVKVGDPVERGAALVVMEAMKMEHIVTARAAGIVRRVFCAVGDQVKEGAELLELGES
jgi:3-methylcrotonyl-CoA carboxylase alpha subunit